MTEDLDRPRKVVVVEDWAAKLVLWEIYSLTQLREYQLSAFHCQMVKVADCWTKQSQRLMSFCELIKVNDEQGWQQCCMSERTGSR